MREGSGKDPKTELPDPDRIPAPGNDEVSSDPVFRDLTIALGLLAVLSALLGLIGMRFGIILISSVYAGYRTIALSAALIWIVTGSIMVIHAARPLRGTSALAAKLVLAAIIIAETIELPLNILGTHSLIELWLTETGKTLISPSSAPMSPVAAVFMILAALSLLFILQVPGEMRKDSRIPDAAGTAGLAIAIASFTFVLSYVFGDPLLYGTQVIPIAAMSALAAFFTGAGLVTTAGPAAVPLKYLAGNSTRARLLRHFLPLVVIIILVQQVVFSTLSAYHLVDDAILVAGSLVLFALVTGYLVSRISGALGNALDRAEQELVQKNEELGAMNEELVAIEEELRQNIDELGKNSEALRESEGRLSLAQQAAGVGIWDWNVITGAITWSPNLYEIFGIDPEKNPASFDIWNSILHPDDREGANMRIQQALGQHGTLNSEYRIIRPDGEVRWINALGQGSYDDQGRPTRMSGICIDITDRKKVEEELRQRQAEIQALFDNIPAGLVLFSGIPPYTVLVHNRYYQELFAEPFRSRGMVGLNVQEYAPAVEASGIVAAFDEVARTKEPRHFLDFPYNSNPPNESWYNWYLSPIILDNNVVALVSMSLEVTARHRAEQALRESEEKYRGLFNTVQESVAIYRLIYDGNGEAVDRIFVDANPKAIAEMGYQKREDIIGKPYSEVVLRHFPGDRKSIDTHLRSLAEVARSGKPLTYDTHFGTRTYITTQYPVNKDLVASSSIDITSRTQAEEALRESETQLRRAQELLDSITKSTGVMIAAEDMELCYTYFNKAYADEIRKLTGKKLTLGMSMVDLFAGMPVEQENSVKQWKKVLGGKSIRQMISFDNPGSEPKTFNVLHTPIRDGEGRVIGAGEVSYDVTRQIQTADELRKTSQYLENLINYANAPIIVWDREFHITRFNHAFERLTGRTAEDVIGQTPDILIPEQYRPNARDLIRKATTGDRWEVVEIPILHAGGETRTVLWNSATLYEDDGTTIIATIAQGQDITERKKALEALKQSESRERAQLEELTKVMDAVPAAVWISHDPQALHISGNRLSAEWLNVPEGANMSKSAHAGERPETFRMFSNGQELLPEEMPVQLSSAGKDVRNYEFDFLYPGGGVRHVLGNATPLFDDKGKPRGSVSAFIDITGRRQAEETMLAEKKKAEGTLSLLNAALESTAEGILVVDTMRKITSYNQNFISLWNITGSEIVTGDDRRVMEFLQLQVKEPEAFLKQSLDLYRSPERESFDMVELNDGRIFERHSKPQKLRDEIIGRVWSYRDVTDRRRAEEKLIVSLQEKETLIREIHHRVKNNLQIISGLLDMTRMRTPDSTTNSILTDMMMKIKTMAQIHTRLYESKQFDRINMGSQIQDQVTDLSTIYGRSGTEIQSEIEVQDVYLPVDQAIPCALVVNEILSNAFKHAFKGRKRGTIRVSVTREDDHIRIIVRDDGVGIPKDVDVYKTTSLGLKLIRSLIMQLNGSVSIVSDHGTEVTVECPFLMGGR